MNLFACLSANTDIRLRVIFGMEIWWWLLDEADEREIWNGSGTRLRGTRYASSPPPPPSPPLGALVKD